MLLHIITLVAHRSTLISLYTRCLWLCAHCAARRLDPRVATRSHTDTDTLSEVQAPTPPGVATPTPAISVALSLVV